MAVSDAAGSNTCPLAGFDVHQAVADHEGILRERFILFQNVEQRSELRDWKQDRSLPIVSIARPARKRKRELPRVDKSLIT